MRATITQYVPGHSALHRLDPRVKVVAVTTLAVALFVRDSYAALAVFGAVALAAVLLSGVPARWFWRGLKPLLWLVGLTFVVQVLFAPGEAFFTLGPIHLTWEGLERATFLSVRLIILVVTGALLTLTTPPVALTDALAWLTRPLRRLRVPTEELALMVTIALRFIPTLLMELDTIMRAQRARGAEFARGGLVTRAKALIPVLIPLFVVSFRRADDLALAMEARCYRPGLTRTRLHPLAAGAGDWLALALVAAVVAVAMVV
jgi:energy-coupling factor transport system permease protein